MGVILRMGMNLCMESMHECESMHGCESVHGRESMCDGVICCCSWTSAPAGGFC